MKPCCLLTSYVWSFMFRSTVARRRQVLRGGGCAAGGMLLADLAGLGQPQAYAVHKGREPDSGEHSSITDSEGRQLL